MLNIQLILWAEILNTMKVMKITKLKKSTNDLQISRNSAQVSQSKLLFLQNMTNFVNFGENVEKIDWVKFF